MNDLQPFKHGEEGTHSVCNKHNIGGKSVCCECSGKTGCSDVPNDTLKEKIEEAVREFQGMRPLVSSVGDQKARQALQDILDMWWKDAAVYKDWLRTTLTTLIDQAREEEENRLLNEIINNFGAFAAFGQDELNDFSLLAKEVKEQVSEQAVAEERARNVGLVEERIKRMEEHGALTPLGETHLEILKGISDFLSPKTDE